ncbi:hypothetical protein FOZ63_023110 [Perkinsus olseni]|uniref:Uncharacterized protein n=1 Tax=Perkinsus olseni TaxID=32597 RepID=A0A7J6TB37_PEROL|nr:hypothetical protein FOZ62_001026 [Perkinsus olseni]KAF4742303.1 hypothetical protein FOZ63_023110 [Perkinsus olseni]
MNELHRSHVSVWDTQNVSVELAEVYAGSDGRRSLVRLRHWDHGRDNSPQVCETVVYHKHPPHPIRRSRVSFGSAASSDDYRDSTTSCGADLWGSVRRGSTLVFWGSVRRTGTLGFWGSADGKRSTLGSNNTGGALLRSTFYLISL